PALKESRDKIDAAMQAIHFLKKRNQQAQDVPLTRTPEEIITQLNSRIREKDAIAQKILSVRKIISNLEPWGEFSRQQLHDLESKDIYIDLYICSKNKFKDEWMETYSIEIIQTIGQVLYFAVIHKAEEEINIDAEHYKLPDISLSEALHKQQDLVAEQETIEQEFNDCAARELPHLIQYRDDLMAKFEFEDTRMNVIKDADDQIIILRGWVSKPLEAGLVEFLEKQSIYYYAEEPSEDDKVPIQLKNNWYAKLFEPIGKLYSLPSYMELDLTAFFAPFFMLFFGFCTADVGYGLLIFAAATFFKFKVKDPKVKPLLSLAQVLGLSTAVMGFVMGSLLAFDMTKFKGIGKYIPITDKTQIFNFALLLGVIQILFGVIMNFFNRVKNGGFKAGISTIGTFLFMIAVSVLGSPMLGANPPAVLKEYMPYVIYVALFLIFFFNSPGKNIFVNLGLGIWEMYNIVTGFFGDLLSYIRLFALGVSGGILGFVINSMAQQFGSIPIIGPIIFIVFMVVGHSVNIALGSLGGFVHPMRLTFVEFYKNSGFSGGGKEYKPFGSKK
ncbi:MAG TPA: V-type ATP synthase subunit I, partial [Candidatus Cloacimonadota bacterium]|nr:V-type ATP synthase subunit I [Candidatus Cloacimonadota bacterium]